MVRDRKDGGAQTPRGELKCPALLLAGVTPCSQRSAEVPGGEGSMGYDDAEEVSVAYPHEDTTAVTL